MMEKFCAPCCTASVDKQISAFVAAILSFIAQILSALIIQDTNYFFGIITFSLCCHAMLFHGIRRQKMSFIFPYLVCQLVCAAYVVGETFAFGSALASTNPKDIGCFYPDVARTSPKNPCSIYFWDSYDDFKSYNSSHPGVNITCSQCYPDFKRYATLVVISEVAVLVSFILTWNIVLRYTLHLRAEKIRQRQCPTRVSYFNHGLSSADVTPPRPPNAPPEYTEKAQSLDPSTLPTTESDFGTEARPNSDPPATEQRIFRTSLPPYTPTHETPVFLQTPASDVSAYATPHAHPEAPTDHPTTATQRVTTIDDLI